MTHMRQLTVWLNVGVAQKRYGDQDLRLVSVTTTRPGEAAGIKASVAVTIRLDVDTFKAPVVPVTVEVPLDRIRLEATAEAAELPAEAPTDALYVDPAEERELGPLEGATEVYAGPNGDTEGDPDRDHGGEGDGCPGEHGGEQV